MKRMYEVIAEKPDPKDRTRTLEIAVGVAFTAERSGTLRIRLDSIPLNFDGALLIHMNDPLSEVEEKP